MVGKKTTTKRKRQNKSKYSEDDLISAVAACKYGMSKHEASRKWKIPRTTLRDVISEKYTVGKHIPGIHLKTVIK